MTNKKFSVNQKRLLSILSSMQPICNKRTTLDTTSYILFEVGHKELTLKSTDLEISLQSSCVVSESFLDSLESFLVPGRRLFDLVREMEGDINFEIKNNQLILKNGNAKLSLNIKDISEFPPFPERIENLMSLQAKSFVEMLNKVAFLIPQNNSNPSLNGLLFEAGKSSITMTATDGHCLAQLVSKKYQLEEPRNWLIPRRGVFEIKKILELSGDENVFLGVCSNQLVFSGEFFNFFTKLLVDPFPSYLEVLDKSEFLPAKIDKNTLIKTLRRASCLLSGQFIAAEFDFKKEGLRVSMHNKEVGEMEENIYLEDFKGDELAMRFYSPYLLNGLQVFAEDKIDFYLKNQYKPVIFEAVNENYSLKYLVMPVSPTNI